MRPTLCYNVSPRKLQMTETRWSFTYLFKASYNLKIISRSQEELVIISSICWTLVYGPERHTKFQHDCWSVTINLETWPAFLWRANMTSLNPSSLWWDQDQQLLGVTSSGKDDKVYDKVRALRYGLGFRNVLRCVSIPREISVSSKVC